ncbi:efflux RND transporter periplasmic adaptor subunit [Brachybacterium sp. JHP9]|uniref:Efflux RND transporter periplasmic adaptor subunit n=1 Tax=Brachybacterium equifaecis TaxID=2910770 RepID=A0ABT0QZT8_9MICO|nr:HlyD family efflux transporter periplasmic adaptor subunit [Brachybacterium equifaecis]MCL6423131.1 efflux RND transporter periplasmic adaptor subunit [Brachybacterium equifaecis]
MTWSNRFRLLGSAILLLAVLAFLILVFTQRQAHVQSTTAVIEQPRFVIGAQYTGIVTDQQVELGDTVTAGQVLFTLSSPALLADAANGVEPSSDIATDINPAEGTVVYKATADGTITELNAIQGGYIIGSTPLATIVQSTPRTVMADFQLSPRDYGRLEQGAKATILLPDNTTVTGEVVSAQVTTEEGQAFTEARIISKELDESDLTLLATDGAPVIVTVQLRSEGFLAGPADAMMDFLQKIGLR